MEDRGHLIGDRAYDSDRLDRDLDERYGVVMIAPHRGVRRSPTQEGPPLRRYRNRWRVERLFAWLHHFRRPVIRWEYYVENFFRMVRLGGMQILFRYLLAVTRTAAPPWDRPSPHGARECNWPAAPRQPARLKPKETSMDQMGSRHRAGLR